MRTDDLIGMLARQAGPTEAAPDMRWLAIGLAGALPVLLAAVALGLGLVSPALWGLSLTGEKIVYALALAAAGLWLMRRIGRPGASVTAPLAALALVLVTALVIGVWDVLRLSPDARAMAVMGKSAAACVISITLLSLPTLGVALSTARRMAPTDLRLAGLAAGLLSGGIGAAIFALSCTEGAPVFVAVWYTLGMLMAGAIGALIGPRVLRW